MYHVDLKFHKVSFYYDGATNFSFEDLTLYIDSGWSGVVGPNGAGKTTLLKLATGLLTPCKGRIDAPSRTVYCSQRTDHSPSQFNEFIDCSSKTARIIKGTLNIHSDWYKRWHTLSHGERKRAQIGAALWLDPDLLAIDEPTNHLDRQGRALIISALQSFSKIGLLISHDRELLDALCHQSFFIDPPHVVRRKGGYTIGKLLAEAEQKAAEKQRAIKKQVYKKLRREVGKRRNKANQADRKRSKRSLAKKDHDGKQKIDGARLSGKDGVHGKLLRQMDGRLNQTKQSFEKIKVKKEAVLGIWLTGTRSKRDKLCELAEGSISLGRHQYLHHPKLMIRPCDRLGITGPNGAGKSTLLEKLANRFNLPQKRVVYIPQEIDIVQSKEILNKAQLLPNLLKGQLMTIVSRLGSCPNRLLESSLPSPGETRKLLLAIGLTRQPHALIMDEPTNHMDLPSIECLEQALLHCPYCLVLISHDLLFLDKLTHKRWHIEREMEDKYLLKILD